MSETVILSFKGTCQGGPWNGQRVDAEEPYVLARGGEYRWKKAVWLWWDQPDEASGLPDDRSVSTRTLGRGEP